MKMKKTTIMSLLAVIMFFMAVPMQTSAKKIKFGEYVVYKGKVMGEEPFGEGTLTIMHPNNKKTKDAVITGIFNGWKVSGTVFFYSEDSSPFYGGDAQIVVAPDGSSVKFELTDGTFIDDNHLEGIEITKENPLTIVCDVKEDIRLSSSEILLTNEVSNAEYGDFRPINIDKVAAKLGGGQKKYFRHGTYQFDKTALKEQRFYETTNFGNNMIAMMDGKVISLTFDKGDSYNYKPGSATPLNFRRTYSDGTVSLKDGDKVIRHEGQGKAGVAVIPTRAEDFETILTANTLNESNLKFYYDELGQLLEKAQNGDQAADAEFKDKVTQRALNIVKAECREHQVASELMEIGKAYQTGNLNIGGLYAKLVENGALKEDIMIQKDSALVWLRMAAAVDTTYQTNVVELEKEMGIYEEPMTDSEREKVKEFLKADTRGVSVIMAEAKRMTRGGNFIEVPYKITVPVVALADITGQEQIPLVATDCKATLEVIPFGAEGVTVTITIDFNGLMESKTLSWSGPNIHLAPGTEDGTSALVVMRGNHKVCGSLLSQKGLWMVMYNPDGLITFLEKGMTRSKVEESLLSEMEFGQFKFNRKVGNLDVYTFYWLGQEDHYSFRKGAVVGTVRNNKPYAHFYFDSKGKLVKWLWLL